MNKEQPNSEDFFEKKESGKHNKWESTRIIFGEVAQRLGVTTQVASFYLDGLGGYPELGGGLEVKKASSYHLWEISKKDADEFVRRVEEYRKESSAR